MTVDISREKAICMFFNVEANKDNITTLISKLDDIRSDVCYENESMKPIIARVEVIQANPLLYKRYPTMAEIQASRQP
ncbi:MAG: hypothetical protein EXX96DRAFT_562399 [Benjaminiella poitrasii]|nr:MAG: hypothetical protein EXX96DRAFT_562399 [Benjaminiella poitrasii]